MKEITHTVEEVKVIASIKVEEKYIVLGIYKGKHWATWEYDEKNLFHRGQYYCKEDSAKEHFKKRILSKITYFED